jgi:hypothetical protein
VTAAREAGTALSVAALGASVLTAVVLVSEVGYRGFVPAPVVVLPLLTVLGLALSIAALVRTRSARARALAALALLISLACLAVVGLLAFIVLLYTA